MNLEANIVYPVRGGQLGGFLYRERPGAAFYVLLPLLWVLSLLYSAMARFRVFLYGKSIFKSARLDACTVSVGNLTVGGTGKTPFVEKLAGELHARGGAVAVLSRGYKRRRGAGVVKVSALPGGVAVVKKTGDEPAMLARRLPDVPVIVAAKRSRAGEVALAEYGARILVLDDGFSHLALQRDCDILLVDGYRGFGPGRCIPFGPLREPPDQVCRADHVVIVGGEEESRKALAEKLKEDYGCGSIIEAVYEPSELVPVTGSSGVPLPESLEGRRCIAFSGLASPAGFEKSIRKLGGKLLCSFRFPDHYWYDREDIEMVVRRARNVGAGLIITTEKDGVKVPHISSKIPICYLRVKLRIVAGEDIYESILQKAIEESTMTKPE